MTNEPLILPKTEVIQILGPLGVVGSIQAWDPWESRKSATYAKYWVSKIARLSHGLGEAEDFEAHFDRVVNKLHHESVLEFIPFLRFGYFGDGMDSKEALPAQSERGMDAVSGYEWTHIEEEEQEVCPATAFLVECPLIVRAQWMRHRSQAFLEMSRRYVKGSKVPFQFYGTEEDAVLDDLFDQAIRTYNHLLDTGWPPERARIAIPQGAMTKFWCAAFDRDWQAFLALRNDPHAQAEIRAFASWIAGYLETKV